MKQAQREPEREGANVAPRATVRRRMFWLYRCRAPGVRAQSIQVIQSAWASASRGHEVTLAVQASRPGVGADKVLRFYGLRPVPTLRLVVLHPHNALAGVQHRLVLAAWLAQGGGVVIARSKRYADRLLAWAPGRVRVVLEAHEVDSAQAEERGQDPRALRALEARVLSQAVGVVANCEGTAELLRAQHPSAPEMAVLHNATHVSRRRTPVGPGEGLGYAGSLRPEKDTAILQHAPLPLDVIGPERPAGWQDLGGVPTCFLGPVPHGELPDRLVRYSALILTEGGGLFGRSLTSPLKLWDYLAVGRPVVAADTPAIQAALASVGASAVPYTVGDVASFQRACRRAQDASVSPIVRTWDERAEQLDDALDRWL